MKTRIAGKGEVDYSVPRIMGILNLTPDSFSDGGKYLGKEAEKHLFGMIDDGADFIDIGGESTRPGSTPISEDEEIERIIPFLREVAPSVSVPISVDTYKPRVAELALDAGADIINDVTGLSDEKMMDVAASNDVPVIIMHMGGGLPTMHDCEINDIMQIVEFLRERKKDAETHGIKQIITDPGIGFGKTMELNNAIVDCVGRFSFDCPVLIGASRKRFLKTYYPECNPDDATVRVSERAVSSGANIVRVHNVKKVADVIRNRILR